MSKHLTIRLAWHDNKWDGKICNDPSNNVYVLVIVLCFPIDLHEIEITY